MTKTKITNMISIFVLIIIIIIITSTQFGISPLDLARHCHKEEVIEILETQQQKLKGQTK